MSEREALLQAISADEEDDLPRLVYADLLDDQGDPERAEFIRIQIEAERHANGSPEHRRLADRAVELVRKNGTLWASGYEPAIPAEADVSVGKAIWSGESGIGLGTGNPFVCPVLWFRRGFVDEITLTPERFFSPGASSIWPAGPSPTLRIQLCHREQYSRDTLGTLANFVEELASAPLLHRFRDVCIVGGFHSTTHEGLRLLASEPALLAKLAGLWLSEDRVGDAGVLPILESPLVTRLRELTIDGTECTPAVVDLLVRSDRFRGMTYLWGVIEGARGLRVFATPGRWPRLRWLVLDGCGLDDLSLRGLMRPGVFPAVEFLGLSCNEIHFSSIRSLLLSGAFPRLWKLGIGATPVTLDEVQSLRAEFGHRVEIGYPERRRHSLASTDTPSAPPIPSP
jgi:uncharacterized protein (TIGR02996 family)